MASALYLENFLESIEYLPPEMKRDFALIGDLDQRAQDTMKEIDSCKKSYKNQVAQLSREEREKQLKKIEDLFQKAKEYTDNKVQIAVQIYEMVDKHIRRLDADLARFEAEIHFKETAGRRASMSDQNTSSSSKRRSSSTSKPSTKKRRSRGTISSDNVSEEDEPGPSGITTPPPIGTFTTAGTDVLDMPVDPNEPTYCLCHQVSYGEMIGCDNQECPIEWFHFQCVGLSAKPKGKWYCPKCEKKK